MIQLGHKMIKGKLLKSLFVFLFLFVVTSSVYAAGEYNPLSDLGSLPGGFSNSGDLRDLLRTMYNFGLGIAAALAVVMVIWGGIEYMTTDAIGHHEEGKQKIQNAVLGLILALSSYIILNTINKDLLNLNFAPKLDKLDQASLIRSGVTVTGATTNPSGVLVDYTGNPLGGTPTQVFLNSNYRNANIYGQTYSANLIAIDTDGTFNPGWDPDYQSQTSLPGLNSFTDNYVALPTSMHVPVGTPVLIVDRTTGRQVQAIHGDNGASGIGEMSVSAAYQLGIWNPSMGNHVDQSHNIDYVIGNY